MIDSIRGTSELINHSIIINFLRGLVRFFPLKAVTVSHHHHKLIKFCPAQKRFLIVDEIVVTIGTKQWHDFEEM